MAVNFTNVTRGNATRGWTGASIAPQVRANAPVGNIPMSGNVPSNILQAVGNLSAEQAFRNFLSNQLMGAPAQPQVIIAPSIDPSAALQAQNIQTQQRASQANNAANQAELARVGQQLAAQPLFFGGISPMGMGAQRAALQQQQFGLEMPRMLNGWMGGF